VLASLIVVFREALEAGLIVGIVLAATQHVAGRLRWIAGGIAAGLAGAAILAACADGLSNLFEGAGQEVFTAAVLSLAVLMLAWHVTWMSSHASELSAQMRLAGEEVRLGKRSLAALATVVGIAVLREGAEVVLFLYGIAMSGQQSAAAMFAGGAIGLVLAAGAAYALFRGLAAIPVGRLFSVTNWLIILLAAGMAGQAAAVLHSADLLPGWGEHIWNTSWLVADGGLAGRTLHALIGYSARPSGVQAAAWAAIFIIITASAHFMARPRRAVSRPAKAAAASLACVAAALAYAAPARAEDIAALTFVQHRFVPDHITVPAGQKFKIEVRNTDDSADEFESVDLNREKLVAPGGKITVFLGPLDAGSYKFFGCFHRDTAQGVIDAK
jgi:high-affinity iron transporter